MAQRAVVIGLDGAAWHLLNPLIAARVMPRLGALRARGAWGTLKSTVPTYTPPAWTSAVTGVNPGRHGIYGFVTGHAQHDRREFVHAGKVRAPAVWEIANRQGVRAGVYNVPLTYPPQPLDGWMVSGMMTPGYGEHLTGFVYPQDLEARILEWAPDYACDTSANYERDWHDEQLCRTALGTIRQRHEVLERLLETAPVDVLFTVLEAPDRLQHVYYRYLDPQDPSYDTSEAAAIRPHLAACFAALDDICGLLDDWAGGGGVVVCSDHGFTAWDVSVHVNALLQEWGFLKIKAAARLMQTRAVRTAVPLAKRWLPRKFAREAKRKTFAAIDWTRTTAFASPIPQQGIFVNLRGRERFGVVDETQLESVKDDLVRHFEQLTAPDGLPATDHVWRSEEVFSGDCLQGAPDVLPVLRDHRFELDDELFHRKPFSDVAHMPRGVHHPDGIVIVAGTGVEAGRRVEAGVADVCPTLLYLAGLDVPRDLDGALIDAFDAGHLQNRPVSFTGALSSAATDGDSPYSEEEEAQIEESLRGLGYL